MLESDIILPSQFLTRTFATPEKRLLLAVLEEAVATFQRYVVATDRHGRAVFADVEAWFASEETAWLYSFVGICDALGIDATYLRSGLGRWLGAHRTPSLETAQPVCYFPFRRVNGCGIEPTAGPQVCDDVPDADSVGTPRVISPSSW